MNKLMEHVVGFVDIGTNSIRLLLVRIEPNGATTTLSVQKETVRLGEAEYIDGFLQASAMQRTAAVCKQFAEMARALNADHIIAVATSATREARNKRDFLRLLRKKTGIDVKVISGIEEARLIYLGISNGVHLDGKTALMIDIGGGSTELIVGNQTEYHHLDSLKLGAIRLHSKFFSQEDNGSISPELYAQMCQTVRNSAIRSVQKIVDKPYDVVYGSSGTIGNLADIVINRNFGRARTRADVITYEQLSQTIDHLLSLDIEERRAVPGINARRADIIIPGAAIIQTLMKEMDISELRITDQGVRNGLLVDYLGKTEYAKSVKEGSVRERSVLKLARKCNFDEAHGYKVSQLCTSLFESANEVGLLKLNDISLELLKYSALLHDIGIFLSYSNHEAHSYYLVRNADLLGFDQAEISTIAALTYFHRKKFPRKKYQQYSSLNRASQSAVRLMAPLLRIAETLDRSHQGTVGNARIVVRGGNAVLQIFPAGDCQMEMWGVDKHKDAFRKTFGMSLQVELMDE